MSGPQISITASGLDGVLNRLKKARSVVQGETSAVIFQALRAAQATVQAGTPKRTGIARGGWHSRRINLLEGVLVNEVRYVPYLIHGTYKMQASATLNEALERARTEAERTLVHAGVRLVAALDKGEK